MNMQIAMISLLFALIESGYFGWNILPQSDAEVICVGIVFLIFALAFIVPAPKHKASSDSEH